MNDNEYLADGAIISQILNNSEINRDEKVTQISAILNNKYNLNQSEENIIWSMRNIYDTQSYSNFKKCLLFKIVAGKDILTIDILSILNKMDPVKPKLNPQLIQQFTNNLLIELDNQMEQLKKVN